MLQKCSNIRILHEFVKNPKTPFQIRELSRKIKLAATSVKLHLKELQRQNLIKQQKGIYKAYIANFDNDDFRFYKKILNLISIKESGLIKYLESQTTPDTVILFGSYAKGEDLENSDIDIFLQAKERSLELKSYERQLNRTIHLFFSEDLNKLPKELQNNIINGTLLSGFLRWKI